MAPGRCKAKAKHVWGRNLEADLGRLKTVYRVDVLVTLLREEEMTAIHQPDLLQKVKAAHIESLFFPIRDKFIPSTMEGVVDLVFAIVNRLHTGQRVVVHCNGGKGRSALILTCVLIAAGHLPSAAIRIVQATREGTMRNPLQQAYANAFSHVWESRKPQDLSQAGIWVKNLDSGSFRLAKSTTHSTEALQSRANDADCHEPPLDTSASGAVADFPRAPSDLIRFDSVPIAAVANVMTAPQPEPYRNRSDDPIRFE